MELRNIDRNGKVEVYYLDEVAAARYVAKMAGMIGKPVAVNVANGCEFTFETGAMITVKGVTAEALRAVFRVNAATGATRVQICDACGRQTATFPARICGD